MIVFCGVHFMAETAAIICPDKTVLLPDLHAGCPMANMITPDGLRQKKKEHPSAKVVCYVNTTAAVKAESDICCTSANAVRVVRKLGDAPEIIFVPDQYLGGWVAEQTGRSMILWPGYCPTHARILPEDIAASPERASLRQGPGAPGVPSGSQSDGRRRSQHRRDDSLRP